MYIFVVDWDENGKVSHCIFAGRDITEEKHREEEYIRSLGIANSRERAALRIAYKDTLTQVMNRSAFERDIASIGDYDHVGFVYCDVNGLRQTNNTLGHNEGDRLLQTFAELMKEHFSVDCIYRIGGDEFVCVIGNLNKTAFEKRVKEFTQAVADNGNIAAVGSAYGESKQHEELLRKAEKHMYAVKYAVEKSKTDENN